MYCDYNEVWWLLSLLIYKTKKGIQVVIQLFISMSREYIHTGYGNQVFGPNEYLPTPVVPYATELLFLYKLFNQRYSSIKDTAVPQASYSKVFLVMDNIQICFKTCKKFQVFFGIIKKKHFVL